MESPKILESLWDRYRDLHIKPESNPEDVKAIAKIFYAGMLAMLSEIVEGNKDIWRQLNTEFAEFDKEITEQEKKGAQNQHRNNPT